MTIVASMTAAWVEGVHSPELEKGYSKWLPPGYALETPFTTVAAWQLQVC
jgi:hypothetical protein